LRDLKIRYSSGMGETHNKFHFEPARNWHSKILVYLVEKNIGAVQVARSKMAEKHSHRINVVQEINKWGSNCLHQPKIMNSLLYIKWILFLYNKMYSY
jgi:hypothetical protein